MPSLSKLPIGIDDFTKLRTDNYLYIDKTAQLEELMSNGQSYFIARPLGFGKSLTLSTLAAMFSGKTELFKGLDAEAFVQEIAKKPYPVLALDFASLNTKNLDYFEKSLTKRMLSLAKAYAVPLEITTIEDTLIDLLEEIYQAFGYIVVLIDNYDKPILRCLDNLELALAIHRTLKSFYDSLQSCSKYLKFLMITGTERYNKTGLFATLDNINDISNNLKLISIFGFTEAELAKNYAAWVALSAQQAHKTPQIILEDLQKESKKFTSEKEIYLYQPFSLLKCLYDNKISDYFSFALANLSQPSQPYTCINQGDRSFLEIKNYHIYVDKTELLIYTNQLINTEHKYICISRPRRFGKTITAKMVASYYDLTGKAERTFQNFKIYNHHSFSTFANKFIVIQLTLQNYLSKYKNIDSILENIKNDIILDLIKQYDYISLSQDINEAMKSVANISGNKFVIVIDEWDCIFREFRDQDDWQKAYLDFLRSWLKDQESIALVYMTGILPIKKYGTHSALNMFNEYSMLSDQTFSEFFGFTEAEVESLCQEYKRDFSECKRWYDGYKIDNCYSIYNPRSVSCYISSGIFKTYWNNTESYEALRSYITMENFGLRTSIIELLANSPVPIETSTFANDMKTFHSRDDILTLLVHLGYLSYDSQSGTVSIPNTELAEEFVTAIRDGGWPIVLAAIQNSSKLLHAVLNLEAETVARGIEAAHQEMSHLQYNDENALAYTISLAFYAAREHYTIVREFPTGKGFADLVFLPRPNCTLPILLVELKWDKTCQAAIAQIHQRHYPDALADRSDKILLVGINYQKESKKHQCCIQWFQL